MSDKQEKIKLGLQEIARKFAPDQFFDGTVEAVDNEAYTCDVLLDIDGSTMYECRLRATASGTKSIDVLPTVGSSVVMALLGGNDYLVLACDEITSYRVTVGDMILTIDENGFGVTNGTDSLKSILTGIVNGLLSVYAPKDVGDITALIAKINGLFQ